MRVLVVSSPIYAHTVNAIPFIVGLQARGAQVDWALAAPFLNVARSVPVERRDTGPVHPFVAPGGALREVSQRYAWLLEDAARRLPGTLSMMRTLRPDVVLTDSLGYPAALAAESLGTPWVTFGDGPLHYPDDSTPPFGAGLPYRTQAPWIWRNRLIRHLSHRVMMRAAHQTYDDLRAGLRLAPGATPVLEAALSTHLHLHCGVPELEYPRHALPEHVHFVGALRPPSPHNWVRPDWWEQIVGAGPVLATQGTLRADPSEVLAPTAAALQQLGRRGVLTTGSGDPSLLGGPGLLSHGRLAVESFVPYEKILPHASVFVTNGGWTGVLLALAHGVPVVQVGRTEEKADIGRRVAWAGAGVHLPSPGPGADPRALVEALRRVSTQPRYREGAQRMASSLAGRDPGTDGAALIEELRPDVR